MIATLLVLSILFTVIVFTIGIHYVSNRMDTSEAHPVVRVNLLSRPQRRIIRQARKSMLSYHDAISRESIRLLRQP